MFLINNLINLTTKLAICNLSCFSCLFNYLNFIFQSQVYRSQPDLVSAAYDTTSSTLAVDYSYGQYPNQTDASQNYSQYPYTSEYTSDSNWVAPEQRKYTITLFGDYTFLKANLFFVQVQVLILWL